MKIVLLKNVKYDFEAVWVADDEIDHGDEYVQISKAIDVDFPMLSDVDLNAEKIKVIDKDIEKAKAGIHLLEQAKAELLAIPDMREENE